MIYTLICPDCELVRDTDKPPANLRYTGRDKEGRIFRKCLECSKKSRTHLYLRRSH